MSGLDDIPQEIWGLAETTLQTIATKHVEIDGDSEVTIYGVPVIANAIMAATEIERQRCLAICAAEREWGDFHPDDVMGRIKRGEQARIISGWNSPSED